MLIDFLRKTFISRSNDVNSPEEIDLILAIIRGTENGKIEWRHLGASIYVAQINKRFTACYQDYQKYPSNKIEQRIRIFKVIGEDYEKEIREVVIKDKKLEKELDDVISRNYKREVIESIDSLMEYLND